ncbi:HupE/UreJ family protein [Hydrocarboniphaga sp.]|uniref:HupE/UreJ family protein n=1 Tax=Hydrocarboniphaga sp. TaxID=2033016 RepID=UPI003D125518
MARGVSALAAISLAVPGLALAHGVAQGDASYLQSLRGVHVFPLMYLGAKHMVTGYDHLLFLAGVMFFLHRLRDVATYATLFAIGHSTTLLLGVLGGVHANAYLVDAIIGLSVVYKALENIGAFKRMGLNINSRVAVLLFGFAHGFGLSTKLQELELSRDGLLGNIVSFNVGVELGQILALTFILLAFQLWRRSRSFQHGAYAVNVIIMSAGFVLFGYQIAGYFIAANRVLHS